MIEVFDTVTLLASLGAFLITIGRWTGSQPRDTRLITAGLMLITAFYAFCLWVEWSGISGAFDVYEDFVGALIPMWWGFVFYAFVQHIGNLKLRKSEENLRITLDSMGEAMIATDVEGFITRMNPVAEHLIGWKLDETHGRRLSDVLNLVDAETGEPMQCPTRKVLESNRVLVAADRPVLKSNDGSEYRIAHIGAPICSTDGNVLGVVLLIRDMTQEYRMRRQLAESEERMKMTLKATDLGTWDWNVKTGEVTFNERWANMLGYELNEIEPTVESWENLLHPDDRAMAMETLQAHLDGKTDSYDLEHRLKHKDGHWVWVMDRGRVMERDRDGQPIRACGTHLDITGEMRLREEKKRLSEQVRQTQKMEAVGRLAGGVAHDLNNLLTPIIGYGELLLDDPAVAEGNRQPISEIVRGGCRARDLVRQLLAYSRKQTLEFKPMDVNTTIRGFEELLRRTIPEDIDIATRTSDDLLPIVADVGQMEQVVMNLAVNAAHAMPNGGKLTIETAMVHLNDDYVSSHPEVTSGDYVMLGVSDTGAGMDTETQERIFEPFYSTKGQQGTGLGLATVYGIVKQHNGHIWVYSEPDHGTTFKIYMPAARDATIEKMVATELSRGLDGTETVLLVEDFEQIRNLANSVLTKRGYTVLTARDGQEALATLRSHDGPVHLLLTDVVMPGMNGRELYQKATEEIPDLRVLYMSGYTDNVIAHRGVLEDGVSFLQKPFTSKGLARAVRAAIEASGGG